MIDKNENQHTAESGLPGMTCSPSSFDAMVRAIGLALSVTHGTIATDDPDAALNDKSWRVDHTDELRMLGEMAAAVKSALVTAPDMGVVIPTFGGGIDKPGENMLWDSAEGITSATREADNHSSSFVSDGGNSGRSDGYHVHGDFIQENVQVEGPADNATPQTEKGN